MQKKIIALAVAGLASTAAFAQSNVTVYGVVDMYAANVGDGSNGTTASVLNSGGLAGSRLGFKGTEDLGNGTKAIFTLEYALGVDQADGVTANKNSAGTEVVGASTTLANGSGIGAARQAFVGLTGAYGTAIAGRLQTLVYNHNSAYNPTFGTGVDTLASVAANGSAAIGTAERLDNAIAYVAPKMGDVTLAAAYTNNAGGTDVGQFSTMTRAYELSATYASGPLSVGGVYRNVLDTASAALTNNNGNNSYAIGASYDVGVAKLMATFGKQQANRDSSNQNKVNLYNLGAVVPVSAAGAVILSYGNSQLDAAGVAADTTRTTYAALYKHNLSKRTALYGGWAKSTGADGGTGSLAGVTSAADASVSVALAGINHSF